MFIGLGLPPRQRPDQAEPPLSAFLEQPQVRLLQGQRQLVAVADEMQVDQDLGPGQQHHFGAPDDGDAGQPGAHVEPVLKPGDRHHRRDYAGAFDFIDATPSIVERIGNRFLRDNPEFLEI